MNPAPAVKSFFFIMQLMTVCERILGKRAFTWLMKKTVYGQFVAGEDLPAIRPSIQQLRESGVRSILDYAVEEDMDKGQDVVMEVRQTNPANLNSCPSQFSTTPQFRPRKVKGVKPTTQSSALTHFYAGEERCEENVRHFKSCIETAARANAPNTQRDAFAAIKLTGLGRVEFLVSSQVEVTLHMYT